MELNASTGGGSMVGVPLSPQPLMPEKKRSSVAEIVILVVVSLIAVTAIGLAVYFYVQWREAQTNIDGKVAEAVEIARGDERRMADEFWAEEIKKPFLEFTGPADYGSLSFMFPRTWSVYVAKDASRGGDFEAYFNPGQVNAVGAETINALRMTIINRPIDSVRTTYDNLVKSGKLSQSVFQMGSITGDRYEGEFSTNITGMMIMLKINDKTAILRTDAMIFKGDFERLIETVSLSF
jgi:hypothetical protein